MKFEQEMMSKFEKKDINIINKTILCDGFFKVYAYQLRHRFFNGQWSPPLTRFCSKHREAVVAVAWDIRRSAFVLVEQFRVGALEHPTSPWLVECVAGLKQPQEESEQAVKRELSEEIGMVPKTIIKLGRIWSSPGGSGECIHLFCAGVDSEKVYSFAGVKKENEDIRVHVIKEETLKLWLEDGTICSGPSIVALQKVLLHKEKIKNQLS